MDNLKNLKFSTKSTKSLYKASIEFLKEVKNETNLDHLEEAVSVWVTVSQLVDYSIEQFLRISDVQLRAEFIEKLEIGIDNIPDEISVEDLIDISMYNKNNLPQA